MKNVFVHPPVAIKISVIIGGVVKCFDCDEVDNPKLAEMLVKAAFRGENPAKKLVDLASPRR